MSSKREICQDIQYNCDVILNRLKDYPVTNDTAEGRMIYQCQWLKERAAAGTLSIPTDDVSTLSYIDTEGNLRHLGKSPEEYRENVEKVLYRLLNLADGNLLLKPLYYPYTIRCIEILLNILRKSTRRLSPSEEALPLELAKLKDLLAKQTIQPPLMYYLPDYPNFRQVYSMTGSSIDDLNGGEVIIKIVAESIFEGIRPASWISPEAANRETSAYEFWA